jgi:hypothetical protein
MFSPALRADTVAISYDELDALKLTQADEALLADNEVTSEPLKNRILFRNIPEVRRILGRDHSVLLEGE